MTNKIGRGRKILIASLCFLLAASVSFLIFLLLFKNKPQENKIDLSEVLSTLPVGTKEVNLSSLENNLEISESGEYLLAGSTDFTVIIGEAVENANFYLYNSSSSINNNSGSKISIAPLEQTDNTINSLVSNGDVELINGGTLVFRGDHEGDFCVDIEGAFVVHQGALIGYDNCEAKVSEIKKDE